LTDVASVLEARIIAEISPNRLECFFRIASPQEGNCRANEQVNKITLEGFKLKGGIDAA
jgi:hypothetical protein